MTFDRRTPLPSSRRPTRADKTYDPMVNGVRRTETLPQEEPGPAGGAEPLAPMSARPQAARARSPYRQAAAGERTLVETAATVGTFVTLGRAIRAAGMVDMLCAKGPITLFAPTDQAFAKLSAEELSLLLADRARLTRMLTRHIVLDTVGPPRPNQPRSTVTIDGGPLTITVEKRGDHGRGFEVDGARIVRAEILASNGVIHAIDTVLSAR